MEKVVRDGKVAVLISPGFGAGWSTWASEASSKPILLFHPKLVELVESNRRSEITTAWMKEALGIDAYDGGSEDLEIVWLPEGTTFTVEEYDGCESIRTSSDLTFTT